MACHHQILKDSCQSSDQLQRLGDHIQVPDSGPEPGRDFCCSRSCSSVKCAELHGLGMPLWDDGSASGFPLHQESSSLSFCWEGWIAVISPVVSHDICKCSHYNAGNRCWKVVRSTCHVAPSPHPHHKTVCVCRENMEVPGRSTQPQHRTGWVQMLLAVPRHSVFSMPMVISWKWN